MPIKQSAPLHAAACIATMRLPQACTLPTAHCALQARALNGFAPKLAVHYFAPKLCTPLWHLPAALPPPRGLDEAGRPSLAWQPPKYVNASSLFRAYYKNTRGPETTLYV